MIKTSTVDKVAQGGFKVKRGWNLGRDGLFKDGWMKGTNIQKTWRRSS